MRACTRRRIGHAKQRGSSARENLFHDNSRLKEFGGNCHNVPTFDGFHLNLFEGFG